METERKLGDLVAAAGQMGPAPEGLTVFRVVQDPTLGRVKVRLYASEEEARQKEAILLAMQGRVAFPDLLGRHGAYLLFRYLEVDPQEESEPLVYQSMGRFLGILNATPAQDITQESLDEEFEGWLERFVRLRLLPPRSAEKARRYYTQTRPPGLPLCLDYWDAMPRNFGWMGDRLYLLDEKHLRPSFPGVGMVKPLFLLPRVEWEHVRQGYASAASLDLFDRQRPFLEFYYLAAALYFYSLTAAAGRVALGKNPRFLEYRERLIDTVSGGSRADLVLGEMHLYLAFPHQTLSLLRRRLGVGRTGAKEHSIS